ncbi:SDR family oxidoreductase [Sphingomonas endolithica]|uniref:SDR family oxidoreductase n=1 Tax=Sphingomonas endolithica TaxID=2972485 RepID=UPI0021AE88B2|nr:SDR family oxidoreductase [Sphingomonas sp. ZFBP2030]
MTDTKRIALVTGANKGIGLEIARQLGATGVHILVGARDWQRGEAAAAQLWAEGMQASFLHIDLGDEASVAAAAATIAADHGRLDILVNNAGINDSGDGRPSVATADALRRVMETNFIGAAIVARHMLPLLKQAPAARIVNLSSALGSLTMNGDTSSPYYAAQLLGYNASKAALNMLTVQLAEELRGTAIAVNSISPGYCATDLNGHSGPLSAAEGARVPVAYALMGDDAPSGGFIEADGPTPW